MELLILAWISLSILFSFIGATRKIGFISALNVCLIISPVIGLIFILLSEKKSDTLYKLRFAHDTGKISDEEYSLQIRKIFPNKEDRKNELNLYAILFVITLILFITFKFFL